ncbi:MAG: 4'-phosphopantetheinyl transferase superfamily protein [Proteobacteria bacterium]|nr:4'-phosphopantetheinyl transferase superfamily protein [Pseudomonadota bacterium]
MITGAHQAPPGIEIFFVDLVSMAVVLESEEARTPRLSTADVERARAMKDAEARRLWRASRIATRIALERLVGPGLRQTAFEIEWSGRPVVPGGGAHFSISHTGSVALIAVSTDVAVGVDLERSDRTLKMSADRRRRVIAAGGRFAAQATLSADKDEDVLVAWVRLEAAAKALGIGIGRLLTQEGVVGGVKETAAQQRAIAVRDLKIGLEHVAAVAAERLPENLAIQTIARATLDEFLHI